MRAPSLVLALAFLSGCAEARAGRDPSFARDEPSEGAMLKGRLSAKAAAVLVTPDTRLGRHLDVVGVLDFHTNAETEEKGFDELRAKAAELGADAVVGAEFEHGEKGEPSHLSGMAVKYATEDTRPYEVLGELDIETPEDADDKGFDRLLWKAGAMGADEIRNIRFEHGKEGGASHLRGTAVRHRSR